MSIDAYGKLLASLLETRTGQHLTMSRHWRIETALQPLLRERGFGYVSLSALGYRHWVRSHTRVAVVGDPDATAIAYPATIRLGALTPVAG